jgi:hypothetical protein
VDRIDVGAEAREILERQRLGDENSQGMERERVGLDGF